MIAADQSFILAMIYMSDAAMQRRSAEHFSGVNRLELEAKADGLRETAMELTRVGLVGASLPR